MKKRQFVDHIRIYVRAGDGGNGIVHFRREKYVPKGGPDGGDGGNGGDVVLMVASDTDNLTHLFFRPRLIAKSGDHGQGREKHGKSGKELVVRVPPGTLVYGSNEKGVSMEELKLQSEPIADLTMNGDMFVIAKGGKGGKGNVHFKSSTNQAPQEHTLGERGEEGFFYLELRQIADAGFVGFPNAGKSSLLSVLSAAKPKVANYPFTTLQPSVGVVQFNSMVRATVADIPGIIEGAHENVGLGHDFLRHIMRCKLLLFVVDIAGTDMRDPIEDIQTLRKEIKLYSDELASRDWMIIANKMDLNGTTTNLDVLRSRFPRIETIGVSALTGQGIDDLKIRLEELIGKEVS
ncbi:MAG: GTPase ObgE [Verrucomicrobiota bacterium]|nr:GTPase ObgE [Verrucomicrobiota bacterium]